ncbi:MAG: NADH-quinone oxidoreductase subunit N [Planctomyces sp.]|nr:NADH-quinone oxidoreductase subunit N [Planctomyces sp.]
MTVTQLLDRFISVDLLRSLEIFCPELILSATVVLLLLCRMIGVDRRIPACWIALAGSLAAFLGVVVQLRFMQSPGLELPSDFFGWAIGGAVRGLAALFHLTEEGVGTPGPYFTGLMMHDALAVMFRLGLLLLLVLTLSLTVLTGLPDQEDGADFYTLLLGAVVGMLMATGVNHLLMLFLSIEMMSVPSYAMVGYLKGRRQSSEAALKFVVYGAGSAGVMLYGLSLLAGLFGTANFHEFAARFTVAMAGEPFSLTSGVVILTLLGVAMLFVGIAFKLSLVPFHFWCPDAFEGASAEVAGFLSIASKAAVFGALLRFATAFTGDGESIRQLTSYLGVGLAVVGAASMTLGNLAAYTQSNLKRMLAYSTIAHAGYMVLAVAAMMVFRSAAPGGLLGSRDPLQESVLAVEGLIYYLAVYLFMNLMAFAAVAFIRNETYREDIDACRGLITGNFWTQLVCVALLLSFASLIGIPPLGGFFAKFLIFRSIFVAGYLHPVLWGVLAIAGLNTVISLFYYFRVMRAVFILPRAENQRPLEMPGVVAAYSVIIALPIFLLGASPLQARLSETARAISASLFY